MAKSNSGRGRQLKQMAERRRAAASGAGRLPVIPRSTWKLAVVTPTPTMDPGEVYDLLLVEDERRLVRAFEMCFRPAGAAELVKVLEQAMRRPERPMKPSQPAALVVASHAAAAALTPIAERHGIALAVDEGIKVGREFLKLAERSGDRLSNGPPLGVPPSCERALAEAADALALLEPWEDFDDDVTFELDRPSQPLAFRFAVVMGALHETYGIALYRSMEDIQRIRDSHNPHRELVESRLAFLSFADELDADQIALCRHRGYPDRSGMYLNCAGVVGGKMRGQLDAADAEDLRAALTALTALFERLAADETLELSEHEQVEVDGEPVGITLHWPQDDAPRFPLPPPICGPDVTVWLQTLPKGAPGLPPALAGREHEALVIQGLKADMLRAAEQLRDQTSYAVLHSGPDMMLVSPSDGALLSICHLPVAVGFPLEMLLEHQTEILLLLMPGGKKLPIAGPDVRKALLVRPLQPELFEPPEIEPLTIERFAADSPFDADERFVFEVSLNGVEPRIWRRFTAPTFAVFDDLHVAIQCAAEWDDAHLYGFYGGWGRDSDVLAEPASSGGLDYGERAAPAAHQTPLFTFFTDRRKRKCAYRYDFGDDWRLTVQLLRVEKGAGPGFELLDGERAFPPEDCGGLPGYANIVASLAAGTMDKGLREWLGDWAPETFHIKRLKAEFLSANG
ncbi:MAG: plasmid pRiA4b ORF-3 family protein [Myxococcota bacterium]